MLRPIYTPKKKLQTAVAQPNELVIKATKAPYVGPYHIFPNGAIHAGAKPSRYSEELETFKTPYNDPNTTRYAEITELQFNNHQAPKFYYPRPSDQDYDKGYINRYFVQKQNELYIIREINEDDFSNINNANRIGINGNLYNTLKLRWVIRGSQKDVEITNTQSLLYNERTMSGISKYLTDRIEFLR